MTLPGFALQPGQSIFDQVVFAAIRAFVSGEYRPGQPFPSVRQLAADLKINPNTAHKVVQHLIQERWLEVRPGVGTFVAAPPEARAADRARLLQQTVEGAHTQGKWAGVCGEMAGDLTALPLLVGLGFDELSMTPGRIPAAKDRIRRLQVENCRELVGRALRCETAEEVLRDLTNST